jgi:uncharacterized protein YbjT (DUF2867 family)
MKILLTGSTGYIAQRLMPVLLQNGHQVVCCVRDKKRFHTGYFSDQVEVVEVDFLRQDTLSAIPKDIDIAYYLIHSMSAQQGDFESLEEICALHFREYINQTQTKQVIYLSGIVNEAALSKHLSSRTDHLKGGHHSRFRQCILRNHSRPG